MLPPKPLPFAMLESFCRQGLEVREMAARLNCHNSHVTRQLRESGLQSAVAAQRRAAAAKRDAAIVKRDTVAAPLPPQAPPPCTDQKPCPLQPIPRAAVPTTILSFEDPAHLPLQVPPHLRKDVATLSRKPQLSLHRRGPALRRLAKHWFAEEKRHFAKQMLRVHRTALKAAVIGGASYRTARKIQDSLHGKRIGRGVAWS